MFDLKAKLLKSGLVTKEQIAKVERSDIVNQDRKRALASLLTMKKSEQYATIRKWVDINRLDKPNDTALDCEKFFIPGLDNQITWITIKKDLINKISSGEACVIGYMSNHGYTHAVVPRDIGEDVGQVFPDWLRVMN